MRIPRFRFTLRWMMVAVAIAALCIVGGMEVSRLRKLSATYRNRAESQARMESMWFPYVKSTEDEADGYAQQAAEAEERLDQILAQGIKPEHDMHSDLGVDFELWRRGIPQAETKRYESTVSKLKSKIRSRRSSESRARSVSSGLHRICDSHAAMKRKYEHAARYPWLTVAPDAPTPKISDVLEQDFDRRFSR